MSEPLVTYVQDHLAGASHALDLLHWMSDAHKDDSLGTFARALHAEITEDRNVLVRIAQRIGAGSSASKEIGAWLSEKISRLTFANQGSTTIGTFESLEFLVLSVAVGTPVNPAPPAQIRTGGITAYGSYLGCVASKRMSG
jgi:hypothetical protein